MKIYLIAPRNPESFWTFDRILPSLGKKCVFPNLSLPTVAGITPKEHEVVLCDVNMPNKNGIEMVEEVKANAKHAKLPIVMLTTEGAKELIERAKKAGACGWIVKPFKADLLVAAVSKLAAAPQPA